MYQKVKTDENKKEKKKEEEKETKIKKKRWKPDTYAIVEKQIPGKTTKPGSENNWTYSKQSTAKNRTQQWVGSV